MHYKILPKQLDAGIILVGHMTVDPSISIDPPSISETYKAILKIKAGKASGICGIYPEYIHYAGNKAMQYLTDLFCTI